MFAPVARQPGKAIVKVSATPQGLPTTVPCSGVDGR